MQRSSYTAEFRADAVALSEQVGSPEAARQLGVAPQTLRSWRTRAGVAALQVGRTAAATEAHKASAEERRTRLADRLLEIAELSSEHALTIMADAKLSEVVGLFTRAIHDHQLLSGAATARTELGTVDAAHGLIDELAVKRRKKAA